MATNKAYAVRFLCDSSYSEIPENWLIDDHHCWWPVKAKNPAQLMSKNVIPTTDGTWEQFEIEIEKTCSSLQSARKYAATTLESTDNDEHNERGRGRRIKRKSQFINSSSEDDSSDRGYSPPPKLQKTCLDTNNQSLTGQASCSVINRDESSVAHIQETVVNLTPSCSIENMPIIIESNILNDKTSEGTSTSASFASFSRLTPQKTVTIDKTILEKIQRTYSEIKLSLASIDDRLKVIEEKTTMSVIEEDYTEIENMLPLNTKEQLQDFEELYHNHNLANKNKFHAFVKSVGGKDGKDFSQRVLKKVFTNKLATLCSWLGQRNNIRICDLHFIDTIKRVVISECKEFKQSNFDNVSSEWFRQAKLRYVRQMTKQNKETN